MYFSGLDGSKNHPVFKQKNPEQIPKSEVAPTEGTLTQIDEVAAYVTIGKSNY